MNAYHNRKMSSVKNLKPKLDIDPDLARMMQADFAVGDETLTAAMREAGT